MDIASRVQAFELSSITEHLDAHGWAMFPKLLTVSESAAIAGLYEDDSRFRSHVVMARHGFGRGEYKYFSYPLPDKIADLRTALYSRLTPLANRWNASMGIDVRYPDTHADFIARCHKAGQTRPTPLLLQYGEGDFNALHQDVYGEHVFPLQARFCCRSPGKISPAASSCSPSSGRACSRGPRSSRCVRAMAWSGRCAIARSRGRVERIL